MRLCAILLFVSSLWVLGASAQNAASGTLRGRVTDPSGAVVPQATVVVKGADGKSLNAKTDQQGVFSVKGLTAGTYDVTINAKGFAGDDEPGVEVTAGQTQELEIKLQIAVE